MKISPEELKEYLESGKRHGLYKETCEEYEKLRIHAKGVFSKERLEERRPSETEEILEYRKKNYAAVSKSPLAKVIMTLSKARRSPDYAITWKGKIPARIVPNESLQNYTENIPGYGSLTDWAFSILLKKNAIDANAVELVAPLENLQDDKYCKPIPLIFNSPNVWEYDELRVFAILKSEGRDRVYYIDDIELIIFDKKDATWNITLQQLVPFGIMPAFRLRGERDEEKDGHIINVSRLEPMATFLNLMADEHSDLQGSKIQHLFPLFWYYQNGACAPCNGTGYILPTEPEGCKKTCTTCTGTGKIKFSPFAHLRLDAAELGKQQVPAPPAGYVMRDTEILKLQRESVSLNKYEALSAVNMQFMEQVPLNNSGESKKVDRDDTLTFVYTFTEDIIWSMDKTAFFMNEWRYSFLIPDAVARKAMLPSIPVPQNLDILPSEYLVDEIAKARAAGASPYIIAKLEKELVAKKFYGDPLLAKQINLFYELDPLPGITVDNKMSLISNNAITKEDFVISSYMPQFIKRALIDDAGFEGKPYAEQMAKLTSYAQEKITANDATKATADEIKQQVMQEQRTSQQGAAAA